MRPSGRGSEPLQVQKAVPDDDEEAAAKLEATVRIVLSCQSKVRIHRNEVHVKALIASTEIAAQPLTSKIFEIYPPALFLRVIGCEVVLGLRRSLADFSYVLPNIRR